MYVAPVSIPMCLIGRGFARFLTTSLSVIVTIGAGIAFLLGYLLPVTYWFELVRRARRAGGAPASVAGGHQRS